jgi:hypothetical protein
LRNLIPKERWDSIIITLKYIRDYLKINNSFSLLVRLLFLP